MCFKLFPPQNHGGLRTSIGSRAPPSSNTVMKRQREEEVCSLMAIAQRADACSYQSPLRRVAARTPAMASFFGQQITPIKRQRDRTVPMDAMSRLMSAATSAARMKKRAQMTLTSLFSGAPAPMEMATACCAACPPSMRNVSARQVPVVQLQRCAHCEVAMGACCARDCAECTSVFCPNCSTINCDEQFDRVFCLSCQYDKAR